jgi:hypothetical protein
VLAEGAWYPIGSDVEDRISQNGDGRLYAVGGDFATDPIIRATADLVREHDAKGKPDSGRVTDRLCTRRDPVTSDYVGYYEDKEKPTPAQGFGEAVAWECRARYSSDDWHKCTKHIYTINLNSESLMVRELTVRQPVPEYISHACEMYLDINYRYIGADTQRLIRDWLRSVSA